MKEKETIFKITLIVSLRGTGPDTLITYWKQDMDKVMRVGPGLLEIDKFDKEFNLIETVYYSFANLVKITRTEREV